MGLGRRELLTAGAMIAAATPMAAAAGPRRAEPVSRASVPDPIVSFSIDGEGDQTDALQAAIDRAARQRRTLHLPPGRIVARRLALRAGTRIVGEPGHSILTLRGEGASLHAQGADGVRLQSLTIVGDSAQMKGGDGGLVDLRQCRDIELRDLDVRQSSRNGVALAGCSGRLTDCVVTGARNAGIFSTDATGLEITYNRIADCADNGILVWRSKAGEDGTRVAGNLVERIGAASGGSGQYGNGINVFRAGGVLVTANRITDCAYTAVRANAASDVQMISNSCARLGEVALYAEFAFEGALIASNLVDAAAAGISVTNFNEGGRLAVIEGNLIRNLRRREHEPVDKRGEGISVEADAVVTGNVVENAPTAGLVLGWGRYMRDVVATSNVIRQARVGIMITADPAAGSCLVANNLIARATDGAIRAMDKGRAFGPDLATTGTTSNRVTLSGNVAT